MRRTAARFSGETRERLEGQLEEARSLAAYLLPGWKYQCDRYQEAASWEERVRREMKWLDQYSDAELGRRWRNGLGKDEEGDGE